MKMVSVKSLLFICILTYSLTASLVHAQDGGQSGFISIDCGLAPDSGPYTETDTDIMYTSDAGFIDSGESKSVSDQSSVKEKQFNTVRSFPLGTRNCYTIKVPQEEGPKYLIRARFMYGNYDSASRPPTFDLHLGGDYWDTLIFSTDEYYSPQQREIIHILPSNYVHICLVNTDKGTPFISVLELRPLNSTNGMYTTISGSLALEVRNHYFSKIEKPIRYKKDIYDRMWYLARYGNDLTTVTSTSDISVADDYRVPEVVLRTALTPAGSGDLVRISWEVSHPEVQLYIYLHFAEVQKLEANQSREFDVYINEEKWDDNLIVLKTSRVSTHYTPSPISGSQSYALSIIKSKSSTLLPIINAWELHTVKKFLSVTTEEIEVAAIISIKSTYGLPTKDWQGDPCFPKHHVWDGLQCSYDNPNLAQIISLNLTKRGLHGVIAPAIANLTSLKSLDLSNNNLNGEVPDFLAQLASLNVLNLKENNFVGPFPLQLLEKSKNGSLRLSFDDQDFDDQANNKNTDCQSTPCKKKNKSLTLHLVAEVVGAIVLCASIFYGILMFTRRKRSDEGELQHKEQRFTYSKVQSVTNKFEKLLGEGSFGKVYYGRIRNTNVAVKMLSPSSDQAYKEFESEVNLLMSVSHKNLISLVGYCNEGSHMGIICEYMAKGSLEEYISEKSSNVLSWEARLRIAMEAAQGLEYLHHECKPAIIHRDVKPGNILLDEQFQGKLADFGLSRAYSVEGGTHVSTIHVAGTPGYTDPDYSSSYRLTAKSDVYSFGIVLLVIITGRRPKIQGRTQIHITEWVDSFVQNGDLIQIVDPKFRGEYNVNSVGKAVGLAMTCASKNPSERPTMKSVVMDLNECLDIEMFDYAFGSKTPMEMNSINSSITDSDTVPLAR